jgi:hypothetical protein
MTTFRMGKYGPNYCWPLASGQVPTAVALRLASDDTTVPTLYTTAAGTTAAANPVTIGVTGGAPGLDTAGNLTFYAPVADTNGNVIEYNAHYTLTGGGTGIVRGLRPQIDPYDLLPHGDQQYPAGTGPVMVDSATGTQYRWTVANGLPVLTRLVGPAVLPGAPTAVAATVSGTTATVTYTPSTVVSTSPTVLYTATASPGGYTGTAASGNLTIPNLSPGTYAFTVTATSIDGTGPASIASVAVTVLATPVGSTLLLAYDFAGTNGGAFDTSKVIEATSFSHVAPDGSSLLNGQGKIITNARTGGDTNDRTTWRANVTTPNDQEALIDLTLGSADAMSAHLGLRCSDDANYSGYRFELSPGGYKLAVKNAYAETTLSTVTTILGTVGTTYRQRIRAVGTRIQGRAWPAVSPEPTTWNIDVTDSTLTSGYATFGLTPGGTQHTNGSSYVLFKNFTVNAASGSGSVITPPPTGAGVGIGLGQRPFAASAFWYADVSGAPIATDSASCAADAVRQMKQYYGSASQTNVALNTTSYAPPIYTVPAGVSPLTNVGFNDVQGKGYFDTGLQSQWTGVPIPSYAVPADGTDSEMVIYQPSSDKMWEFWVAQKTGSTWIAAWGGRLDSCSTSNGIFPGGYGTTATGLPFLGGTITIAELQAAAAGNIDAINHAMGISFVETASGYSWPAQRGDGGYGTTPIQEGRRFRIDPGLNVAALNVNNIVKAVARAGQRYGFVVWDKAGSVSMRAENPKGPVSQGQTDPYPAIFGADVYWNVLNAMPWTSLQALPVNYGM